MIFFRIQLFCSLTVKAVSHQFGKEFIRDRILLHSLKRNTPEGLHDTDLMWKVNHKLRKKAASKGEMIDVIEECLRVLAIKDHYS